MQRHENTTPSCERHGKDALPMIEDRGVSVHLIHGTAYGETAPARMRSETFYADAQLGAGRRLPMPDDHEDHGICICEGAITIAGQEFAAPQMMIFRPGEKVAVAAGDEGAGLILGGATISGPRCIWWKFVAPSRERSEQARVERRAARWGAGRFELPGNDRDEHVPLPE